MGSETMRAMLSMLLIGLLYASAAPTCPKGCVCDFEAHEESECQSSVTCPCGTALPEEFSSVDCAYFWLNAAGPSKEQEWLKSIPSSARRVDLFGCGVATIPDGSFSHLKQIRVLNLEYNSLTELGPKTLDGLTNLKVLWLTGHHLRTDDTPPEQYKVMHPLQNRIQTIHQDAFSDNAKLAVLLMHHNKIKQLPVGLFDAPGRSLRVLKLLDNPIEPHPVPGKAALKPLEDVKQLDIEDDSGDELEDWMEETGHYLDDENGDSIKWWRLQSEMRDQWDRDEI